MKERATNWKLMINFTTNVLSVMLASLMKIFWIFSLNLISTNAKQTLFSTLKTLTWKKKVQISPTNHIEPSLSQTKDKLINWSLLVSTWTKQTNQVLLPIATGFLPTFQKQSHFVSNITKLGGIIHQQSKGPLNNLYVFLINKGFEVPPKQNICFDQVSCSSLFWRCNPRWLSPLPKYKKDTLAQPDDVCPSSKDPNYNGIKEYATLFDGLLGRSGEIVPKRQSESSLDFSKSSSNTSRIHIDVLHYNKRTVGFSSWNHSKKMIR